MINYQLVTFWYDWTTPTVKPKKRKTCYNGNKHLQNGEIVYFYGKYIRVRLIFKRGVAEITEF